MTPLFPPPTFVFDPIVMLAWGGIASAVPLVMLVFLGILRNKLGVVVSLVLVAVTFTVGAVFIGPADAQRVAAQQRYAVVSEWLDEYYPQYGGAELYEYVGTGENFRATGLDGREYTMFFDFDGESGTRLVSVENGYDEGVPPVGDIRSLEDLLAAQAEEDAD